MGAYKRYVIKITHYSEGSLELYDLIVPSRIPKEKVKQQFEMAIDYVNLFQWVSTKEEAIGFKEKYDKYFDLMFDLNNEGKLENLSDILWYYLKDICGYTIEKHKVDADFEVHW